VTDEVPRYELYAIRYARREARRPEHFIGGDPHDGPMPMDYFTWVATSAERSIVIDTGFTAAMAEKRRREFLRCPIDALGLLGLAADTVNDVVLTHLHYDHVGNFHRFPVARFHLQEPELAYATGRYMRHPFLSHAYEVEEVCGIVRLNYGGRVVFHNGAASIAPGIEAHLAGGHTGGIQYVRVHTARGWVVLASDVSHYYANMETGRPYTIAFHVGDMLEAFDKLAAAAPSRDHIVPGHDPLVMQRYPAPRPDLEGVIVRLDVMPRRVGP
jgi:glyoxylase-like metal-dependent hydrolase (beta-lactamase superfamily II)